MKAEVGVSTAVTVFAALADPTRRTILDLLASGPLKAGDIAAKFQRLTQPAVSRHLKVLRDAHLVEVTVKAQERIYAMNPEGLVELFNWVAKYQAMWPQTLDALEQYLDERALDKKTKGE